MRDLTDHTWGSDFWHLEDALSLLWENPLFLTTRKDVIVVGSSVCAGCFFFECGFWVVLTVFFLISDRFRLRFCCAACWSLGKEECNSRRLGSADI